jgi:hypothetical protein
MESSLSVHDRPKNNEPAKNTPRPIVWFNALLALPALISLLAGLRNAVMINSGDLQWSGAHLTLDHIDPYHQELIHDPQHLILFNQVPRLTTCTSFMCCSCLSGP